MGKYTELSKMIVENVDSLTHCVTRLPFKLKDEAIANQAKKIWNHFHKIKESTYKEIPKKR